MNTYRQCSAPETIIYEEWVMIEESTLRNAITVEQYSHNHFNKRLINPTIWERTREWNTIPIIEFMGLTIELDPYTRTKELKERSNFEARNNWLAG